MLAHTTTLDHSISSSPLRWPGVGLRWISAAAVGALVTIALFLLMRALVQVDAVASTPVQEVEPFVISEYVPPMPTEPRDPPQPDAFVAPPPAPVIQIEAQGLPDEAGVSGLVPPTVTLDAETIAGTVDISAPPPLTTRVAPTYPPRELQRGVTGSCVIQYDILASGVTANAQVVRCDSRGFERASLAAVAQWRHGVMSDQAPDAVVTRGLQTRLDFTLND